MPTQVHITVTRAAGHYAVAVFQYLLPDALHETTGATAEAAIVAAKSWCAERAAVVLRVDTSAVDGIYLDDAGNRFRPVGHVPYAELTVGSVFAQEGSGRAFRRTLADQPKKTGDSFADYMLNRLYNATVILLEPIGDI